MDDEREKIGNLVASSLIVSRALKISSHTCVQFSTDLCSFHPVLFHQNNVSIYVSRARYRNNRDGFGTLPNLIQILCQIL